MKKILKYSFEEITNCDMCGDSTTHHKVLGIRLNQSQGLRPKQKTGIAVGVKQCTDCGLIYASPQPVPADIQDHYGQPPESYWIPAYFSWDPGYFAGQIKTVKELLPFTAGMKALDVGAGLGKCMLSLTNADFDTYGFEPSVPFRDRAINKMNIPADRIKLGMIETVNYPEETFDFITFGAVLEHLYYPSESIEKALKWLKPGGIIQIEVPSSKHLVAKIINLYFRLKGTNYVTNLSPMHAPFHLYEFDLKSFEKLGTRLPFEIAQHEFSVCNIDFIPRFLHPLFRKYMELTDTGMQLTVYLRKKP